MCRRAAAESERRPPLRSPDRNDDVPSSRARKRRRRRCPLRQGPGRRPPSPGTIASARLPGAGGPGRRPACGPGGYRAPAATLAVLAIIFTVVGVHPNQQDDRLHNEGVPVAFTVSGCLGLLGGSGSDAGRLLGRGTYTLDGHRYSDAPGQRLPPAGLNRPAIAVPGDPALVAPASIVTTEHSSAGVLRAPGDPGGRPAAPRRPAPRAAPPTSGSPRGGDLGGTNHSP